MTDRTTSIHQRVQSQFGAATAAYTTSLGHGDPQQLRRVIELAQPQITDHALDVATGTGHTALALAPYIASVIAYDITAEMLATAEQQARQRGLENVFTQLGSAEALPFPDQSFEIVTVRMATHHFADLPQALAEMARVTRSGGRVVVVDTTVPEDDTLDAAINHLEVLRDPSHVRNYQPSQWQTMLHTAGLQIKVTEVDDYDEQGPVSFHDWTQRIHTPPAAVQELEALFRGASPALATTLKITCTPDDIGFVLPKITLAAIKP